jgi:hypothetical protein
MSLLKRTLLISGGVILLAIILVILLLSPIAKWLVEKYDVQYTGREITMESAYVNPLTGYVQFNDLVIKEQIGDSAFLSMPELGADFAMLKLIAGNYEISKITLFQPKGFAVYHKTYFNFNDIIQLFETDTLDTTIRTPVQFSLLNIEIIDGEFHYVEEGTPVNYFIKNVNIQSEGLKYEVDTMPISFSFSSGMGTGDIAGNITINLINLDYNLDFRIENFNLEIINQYLKDITEYGSFAAVLDAEMISTGNFASADSITTRGDIAVTDFHFGKNEAEDFASFDRLSIAIEHLSPKDLIYQYDSLILTKPYFRYEMYDYLDNIQTMFGTDGENLSEISNNPDKFNLVIEIAQLVDQLSRNFFRSQYSIGKVAVYDANLQFYDYTLGEEFYIALHPLTATADSVNKTNTKIELNLKSQIEPFGKMVVYLNVNPADSTSFNMNYQFNDVALTTFNPYLINYTSFPLDRGTLEMNGDWHVNHGNLKSTNHLLLIDPLPGKKVKNKLNKWIPVPLALAFIRENGNVVDYDIPITGDLKNPNFHLRDVLLDLLKNIFIKPVTTPYRIELRNIEQQIEKSFLIRFAPGSAEISSKQKKFIEQIAEFLRENPDAIIYLSPEHFIRKEKETIFLFEAKRRYWTAKRNNGSKISQADSTDIARMSIKDEGFLKYLDSHVEDELLFTTYHKAKRLIDASIVNNKYEELKKARKKVLTNLFIRESVQNQIQFNDGVTKTPFNGQSCYSITYKKEFPEYIIKAFEKMTELNNQPVREKYKINRKKISRQNQ